MNACEYIHIFHIRLYLKLDRLEAFGSLEIINRAAS